MSTFKQLQCWRPSPPKGTPAQLEFTDEFYQILKEWFSSCFIQIIEEMEKVKAMHSLICWRQCNLVKQDKDGAGVEKYTLIYLLSVTVGMQR